MALLEVESLHVSYGDTRILFDIDLTLDEGEVVAIVGANGAGKTTLMRAIAMLQGSSSGDVRLDGQRLNGAPTHAAVARGLVYVPEGRRLFPRLSVRTNLELGAFTPRARARRSNTLQTVYDLFPVLHDRQTQLAGTLSGGEQQMCAIGRGLMAQPRILMIDEVSLGLAPVVVSSVYQAIARIRTLGTAVLLVEQNVQRAIRACDRGYVIKQGRVALQGSREMLRDNPEIRKAYLGSVNAI